MFGKIIRWDINIRYDPHDLFSVPMFTKDWKRMAFYFLISFGKY